MHSNKNTSSFVAGFMARQFARDLRAFDAERQARKAENARRRAECQADQKLVEALETEARRRGEPGIDWVDYFRNLDINYP
jgi:spore cortex formation protein SpoVR/YcgB (stage V sporulation)